MQSAKRSTRGAPGFTHATSALRFRRCSSLGGMLTVLVVNEGHSERREGKMRDNEERARVVSECKTRAAAKSVRERSALRGSQSAELCAQPRAAGAGAGACSYP